MGFAKSLGNIGKSIGKGAFNMGRDMTKVMVTGSIDGKKPFLKSNFSSNKMPQKVADKAGPVPVKTKNDTVWRAGGYATQSDIVKWLVDHKEDVRRATNNRVILSDVKKAEEYAKQIFPDRFRIGGVVSKKEAMRDHFGVVPYFEEKEYYKKSPIERFDAKEDIAVLKKAVGEDGKK